MTKTPPKVPLTIQKKPPKRRFNTFDDVRKYVVDLINRFEADEIDLKLANQLTYMATIMMQAMSALEKSKPPEEKLLRFRVNIIDDVGDEVDPRELGGTDSTNNQPAS